MNKKENNMNIRSFGVVILAVCMLAIGYTAGKLTKGDPMQSLKTLVSDQPDLSLFWSVWDTMQSEFVNPEGITVEDMQYGAIKGLVDAYDDPATIFLTPEETELFNSSNEGKYFEGIGAELGYEDKNIIVVSPIDGSPAKAAGIRPGDYILAVDGEEIYRGDNIYGVVNLIRGEAGTVVTLTVLHKGDMQSVDIEITRGEITVPSMSFEYKDDIAYIDIARFTDNSYVSWLKAWDKIVDEITENGTKKVIIDLRGNPGGYFDAAVYVADDFLSGTQTISFQEDGNGKKHTFSSTKGGDLTEVELVILVDAGSASASEILSGALSQNDRAIVVGESTYGKGTAQAIENFTDGSSLHITVFKWLLPDESWINRENPIVPDFEVEFTTEDFTNGEDPQLEKALELLK
ncbi:S41 family peptidase [bacterium]|nr:S41 family peptidase [bacterium]